MASGGKGWKEQDGGGGGGSWLLTGLKIGAALGAAALGAYAAVKVVEQEKKEEPMAQKACNISSSSDEEEECGRGRGNTSAPSTSGGSRRGHGQAAEPRRREPARSLLDQLDKFYCAHISASSAKQMAIQDVVAKTRHRLSNYLMKNHRGLVSGELMPPALEELYSRPKAGYKLALPLAFNPKLWELIDAADTVLDAPGAFCVRRANLDFFQVGQSPWDRFLVGSYLSPDLLVGYWKNVFERKLRDEMFLDFYCSIKRMAGQLELYVENPIGPHSSMICIRLIPTMRFQSGQGSVTVTSEPVARSQPAVATPGRGPSGNPHENLWQHSREEEAVRELKALDKDGGCRQKCLAILDALRAFHPPLRMLSTYALVTVLLTVCREETEWEPAMLAERFLDLLVALEGYLRVGELRDHYDGRVNIFSQCCSTGRIGESQRWLAHTLEAKERISALLCD